MNDYTDKRTMRKSGHYPDREQLIKRVFELLAKGLTNETIGERTGVSEATVSRIRNGDRPPRASEPPHKAESRESASRLGMDTFNKLWKST